MAGFRASSSTATALSLRPSVLPLSCWLYLQQVPPVVCTHPDVYHSYSPRFQGNVQDCCFPKWQLKMSRKKKKHWPSLALKGHQDWREESRMIDSITLTGLLIFPKSKDASKERTRVFITTADLLPATSCSFTFPLLSTVPFMTSVKLPPF